MTIKINWLPMLIGMAIAFVLLAFITRISFFGVECFAIGGSDDIGGLKCLKPPVYYGAWLVAAIFIMLGLAGGENASRWVGRIVLLIFLTVFGGSAYWYYTTKMQAPEGDATSPAAPSADVISPDWSPAPDGVAPPSPTDPAPAADGTTPPPDGTTSTAAGPPAYTAPTEQNDDSPPSTGYADSHPQHRLCRYEETPSGTNSEGGAFCWYHCELDPEPITRRPKKCTP